MIYKLLISYDINKKDEHKRKAMENYLKDSKTHAGWIHLQGSFWVVLSKINSKDKFDKLFAFLPNSSVAVVDITGRKVEYDDISEECKSKGRVILESKF
jgi:hypothetical protein